MTLPRVAVGQNLDSFDASIAGGFIIQRISTGEATRVHL